MTQRFIPRARTPSFGSRFLVEFERATTDLLSNSELGAVFRQSGRRYVLRRFPYSVFYQVAGDEIRGIAVAHQRRRPLNWAGRK